MGEQKDVFWEMPLNEMNRMVLPYGAIRIDARDLSTVGVLLPASAGDPLIGKWYSFLVHNERISFFLL